jgi:hypothetical protein
MKIQTSHCPNADDLEFPAINPANAGIRDPFRLNTSPPAGW